MANNLPLNLLESLPEDLYDIEIDVNIKPGSLKIVEGTHKGLEESTFIFLSHYCHPGQLNDGLAGVLIMFEVLKRIKKGIRLLGLHTNRLQCQRLLVVVYI